MKTIFNCKVLVLLMLLVSHGLAIAATRLVTQEEALQLAKSGFEDKDVASSLSNDAKEAITRTYALIISGGIAPVSNYERYWNGR